MGASAAGLDGDGRLAGPAGGSNDDALARWTGLFAPGERTLPVMLRRQAERFPDRRLFVVDEATWTFAEAIAVASGTARRLAEAGIAPGDRVAILCGNGPALMQVYLGCAWAGAVAVPINTASRGAQLEHILRNCGATLAAVDASFWPNVLALESAGLPLERVWLVGEGRAEAGPWQVGPLPEPGSPAEPHPSRPGDTVAILYTSGTTGLSKGVCCPQAQYFWWAAHTATLLGLGEGEVLLTPLPLFHTNALNSFYQAILTGSTLVAEPRFSVSGFTAALARHGATVTYLLGAMAPMLLSRPPSEEDRAHRTRIALAPGVPAEHHETFTRRFGIGLVDGYGSTETNFVIGEPPGHQEPGWMGRVRPGFSAQVVDGEDNPLPPDEPGELVLRADEPFAFATGYFGMDDKTVEAWRNLRFHTGDRVVMRADGRFRFLDRMKDAIRRRGENISSFEVEQVLVAHPAVANAAVFPVRSELAEDEVMTAVVLQAGARIGAAELLDFCQPRMPYFAVPRYVEFVEALPMTENGKVQKFKLRERGVTPATWDREAAGYLVRR
ncbi:MAG: ATP-dependent acyl-CoA ligase [Methylobacteriaceae bacterium]|nr:ATP-dependent acyl-CoA ligase [Methylobacteriaceae bacterium]